MEFNKLKERISSDAHDTLDKIDKQIQFKSKEEVGKDWKRIKEMYSKRMVIPTFGTIFPFTFNTVPAVSNSGKSNDALWNAYAMASTGKKVCFISTEEVISKVKSKSELYPLLGHNIVFVAVEQESEDYFKMLPLVCATKGIELIIMDYLEPTIVNARANAPRELIEKLCKALNDGLNYVADLVLNKEMNSLLGFLAYVQSNREAYGDSFEVKERLAESPALLATMVAEGLPAYKKSETARSLIKLGKPVYDLDGQRIFNQTRAVQLCKTRDNNDSLGAVMLQDVNLEEGTKVICAEHRTSTSKKLIGHQFHYYRFEKDGQLLLSEDNINFELYKPENQKLSNIEEEEELSERALEIQEINKKQHRANKLQALIKELEKKKETVDNPDLIKSLNKRKSAFEKELKELNNFLVKKELEALEEEEGIVESPFDNYERETNKEFQINEKEPIKETQKEFQINKQKEEKTEEIEKEFSL